MANTHLLLIGYRGCGKTSVGKLLAELLSRDFVDTDIAIETRAGKSIAEIFAEVGEEGFRDLESNQIAGLDSLKESKIISLGGGAILRPENRRCICSLGKSVWLQATHETIFERISKDETTQTRRPKLSKLSDRDEIRTILETRVPWYKEVADLVVSTDGLSMQEVAKNIVDWHKRFT